MEIITNFGRAFFFGFSIPSSIVALIIRVLFMILLCGIFGIIDPNTWGYTEDLIFSASVTVFIFLILVVLYVLNKFLDSTFELTSTYSVEDLDADQPPEGISSSLWGVAHGYNFSDEASRSDSVFELIQNGFPADEVFALADYLKSKPIQSHVEENEGYTNEYLKCGNSIFHFPWNRNQINRTFPHDTRFLYVILGTILTFIECFTVSYTMKFYTNSQIWWVCIVSGLSIFCILCQPVDDPYSLNHSEMCTGLTRIFFVSEMSSILVLCDKILEWTSAENNVSHLSEFNGLVIDWISVIPYVEEICKFGIFLLPIWIFFVISPPHDVITWFFEFVCRYFYGCSGCTSFFNSIYQFLKCSIAYVCIFFWEREITFEYHTLVIIALCSLFLQIPDTIIPIRKLWKYIIQILLSSGFITGAFYLGEYISVLSSEISILTLTILFDLIYPLSKTFNLYLIFNLRVMARRIPIVSTIRYFWHSIQSGLILGMLYKSESIKPQLFSFLVIMVINKCLSNPTAVFSSVVVFYMLRYEFLWESTAGCAFASMFISRKLLTLISTVRYSVLGRLSILHQIAEIDFSYDDEFIMSFILYVISVVVPFIDRSLSGPGVAWSIITGAPVHIPAAFEILQLPAHIRPNAFWNLFTSPRYDVVKMIESHASEHPVESPLYLSALQALTSHLSQFILEGTFGCVDENDFFILKGSKMTMFVHVVSLSPSGPSFQIRGLEYKSETICHQTEVSFIDNLCDLLAKDWTSIFSSGLQILSMMWDVATLQLQLPMYDLSNTPLSSLISSTNHETIIKWLSYISAYYISRMPEILLNVPIDNTEEQTHRESLEFFGMESDNVSLMQANHLINSILKCFTGNWESFADKLFNAFHESAVFEDADAWIDSDERIAEHVIVPTVRLTVLSLYLEQASLVSPPALDDDILDHFEHYSEDHLIAPASSPEFAHEFQISRRALLSLENLNNTKSVIYFHHSRPTWNVLRVNRNTIRALWASEACEQIFILVDEPERLSIQSMAPYLHNLINQACDLPIGYPAFVSPVVTSHFTFF